MRYAAVTPAITVPQKKIFFAMVPPLRIHTLLGCTSARSEAWLNGFRYTGLKHIHGPIAQSVRAADS
jgi:hypothetical protein